MLKQIMNHKPTTDLQHPLQKFRVLQARLKSTIIQRDQNIATIASLQRNLQYDAQQIKKLREEIGALVPELDGYVQCQKQATFLSQL